MSRLLRVHVDNPKVRLIYQVVEILQLGGLIAFPTEAAYAVGCCISNKKAIE